MVMDQVSEGIDFSDDEGRAVIIAGIPYAPLTDPKVPKPLLVCRKWRPCGLV